MVSQKYINLVERTLLWLDAGILNVPAIAKSLKTTQKKIKWIIEVEYFGKGVKSKMEKQTDDVKIHVNEPLTDELIEKWLKELGLERGYEYGNV